jgi:hypothetical protein
MGAIFGRFSTHDSDPKLMTILYWCKFNSSATIVRDWTEGLKGQGHRHYLCLHRLSIKVKIATICEPGSLTAILRDADFVVEKSGYPSRFTTADRHGLNGELKPGVGLVPWFWF